MSAQGYAVNVRDEMELESALRLARREWDHLHLQRLLHGHDWAERIKCCARCGEPMPEAAR